MKTRDDNTEPNGDGMLPLGFGAGHCDANPSPSPSLRGRGKIPNANWVAPITAIAISGDENEIVVGSQNGIEVRSWPEQKSLRRLATESTNIHDVAFSNEHKLLAVVGGRPGESGSVEIFQWPAGKLVNRIKPHRDVVYGVAWSQDNKRIVTASADGTLQNIEVPSGKTASTISGHSRPVTCVAWLPNDAAIVSGSLDESVRVWDVATGEPIRTLSNHTRPVLGLAVRPTKEEPPQVASIGADKTVRLWQPTIGRMVRFAKLSSEPRAVAWTNDGKWIVTAGVDGKVRVIDPDTAEVKHELAAIDGVAHCLAVTRDGHVIVGGVNGQIKSVKIPQ